VFPSEIVPFLPPLLAEFSDKSSVLLWRGSRDGFSARDFHDRCDGHAPTLTLILHTEGNIFGGFTPVAWESCEWNNRFKADPSLKSFLFTLKNPHNCPPRKFWLRADMKDKAIGCLAAWGPHFCDIRISDNCRSGTSQTWSFGSTYTNDTGLDGRTFFTRSQEFTVKEIEVFQIFN
jgi:hypothetical protein